MIFIILSVVQSTLILIVFKLFDRYRIDNLQALVANYITAGVFGLILSFRLASPQGIIHNNWLGYAVFLGFLFIGTFFCFALSSQKVGIALTSVTSKMSVVIPVILSIFLFSEKINLMRIAGIIIALIAFYLTFKKDEKRRSDPRMLILPLLVFFGNGLVDTAMKYSQHYYITDDLVQFLTAVFFTSFLIGSAILSVRVIRRTSKLHFKSFAGGILLGLLNFGSTFYLIKAMERHESSVVFPLANAAIVGLSSLAGYFGFREKLSLVNWTGIVLSIIAILIIANV